MFVSGSCQKDLGAPQEQVPPTDVVYEAVTFDVTVPSGPQVRTSYGETVTFDPKLYVEVYLEGTLINVEKKIQPKEGSDAEWVVTISLMRNYDYDIVFWAQKENAPYTLDWKNAKITADYSEKIAANDVTRDAFYNVVLKYNCNTYAEDEKARDVELRRPFAQINLGAADYSALEDIYDFIGKDLNDLKTTIAAAKVPCVLNVLTGVADTEAEVKFALADATALAVAADDIVHEEKHYTLVGSNYIFANPHDQDGRLSELTLIFGYNGQKFELKVPNVPYSRNYQTNILGNFFTSDEKFDAVIVPGFETPDYIL